MTRIIMFVILIACIISFEAAAQKRYGYAILHLRCGNQDPTRDRVYYSPIIELNALNFPMYTMDIDPSIPMYSVRYYNYSLLKWFELFIKQYYNVQVTDPEKYERKFTAVVLNDKNTLSCNDQKTNTACFFTDKNELIIQRANAINNNKSPAFRDHICEVVSLD